MFRNSLPAGQEPDAPTSLQESIGTLLGPRPDSTAIFGRARTGVRHDLETQKIALLAYRAKLVALVYFLEQFEERRLLESYQPSVTGADNKPHAA